MRTNTHKIIDLPPFGIEYSSWTVSSVITVSVSGWDRYKQLFAVFGWCEVDDEDAGTS